jgi:hypothetical protein
MKDNIHVRSASDNDGHPALRARQIIRLKNWAKVQLARSPFLFGLALRLWPWIKYGLLKLRWNLIARVGMDAWRPDIHRKIWLSPDKIEFSALREFSIYEFNGQEMRGDWDLPLKRFEDLDIHIAIQEVTTGQKHWSETVFYQRTLERLNRGDILWGCMNQSDLDNRCQGIEILYNDIKNLGYKSQEELLQKSRRNDPVQVEDEVVVGVSRQGDFLFCNSAHRLAIAKLLRIPAIPVKVAVYHPAWVNFRKELLLYAKQQGGKLYQPANHPDLADIPSFHECKNRFRWIEENMTSQNGTVLDIGANIGYFCHRFEAKGFDCCAVENSKRELYFLNRLRDAAHCKFQIISNSILEDEKIDAARYDVVLALNIFHHFLKTESDYNKLVNFLGKLRAKELFFESHLPNEEQMIGAFRDFSPDDFVGFLLEKTGLKQAKLIGRDGDGRPLYRLA